MSFSWSPPPSIYTDPRRLRSTFPGRRSGYSFRPTRPYIRKGPLSPPPPHKAFAPLAAELPAHTPREPLALPLYIDSSMLTAWRSCRRKHFWSTLSALYPMGTSIHLHAGAAIAAGCEAARKHVFSQPAPSAVPLEEVLFHAYSAFSLAWGSYVPPQTPRLVKTFENCWHCLSDYLTQYHPGLDAIQPLLRVDGSPAVEYRFAIPLPIDHPTGEPFLFVGRFDMLGSWNGLVAPVDEKTTSQFGASWADGWSLRGQFLGYVWAVREQGIPCSTMVVRGLKIAKTGPEFQTAVLAFPDHLISTWYRHLLRDVQQIKEAFIHLTTREDADTRDAAYPMNFGDSCQSYGGCAFEPLCSASNPYDFTSNFNHYVWNPLAPNPIEEQSNA